MQQHLQKQATGKTSQANSNSLAAAVAAANKGNLTMGLNQRAIIAAQQQLAQAALKRAAPGSVRFFLHQIICCLDQLDCCQANYEHDVW